MKKLLNEIAEVSAGQGAPQGDENYSIDGTPFVKAGNLYDLINGESIDLIQKVNDDIASKYRLKKFPAGTVVFAKSGMSCLKGYVYVLPTEAYVVNHLACIVPYFGLSEYLKFYFMHHKPSELIRDSSYPSIRLSDISDIVINLPELSECMNIVKILKNTERVIKIKKLQLLEFDQLIKSRFVEMFGDPESNTKKYPMVNLSDIAQYFNGLTYSPENVSDEGIIVLRSSNIQNSKLDFNDQVRVRLNVKESKMVKENDILMCSRNGSAKLVGKVALIDNLPERMAFGAFMMIIRSEYYAYLMSYFQMDAFRRQITTGATTTINQITSRMLDNVKLPLPEKNEVKKFELLVKQVDKLKFEDEFLHYKIDILE